MLSNIGIVSYGAGAVLFALLALLLATRWRGRMGGRLFFLVAAASAAWAVILATTAAQSTQMSLGLLAIADATRSLLWIALLWRLISGDERAQRDTAVPVSMRRLFVGGVVAITVANLLVYIYAFVSATPHIAEIAFIITGFVLAVSALVLVEQLFRNSPLDMRWTIKFFCLAVGGIFAYDLYLFATGLLFLNLNADLFDARGAINALAVPLIAVSVARSGRLAIQQFVSRRVVFYSTALLGIGLYLMIMAAGGYVVRIYGGNWGAFTQILFLGGALFLLATVLFSGQVRARLKVFLSKHFFDFRYDYREEWLSLTRTLSSTDTETSLAQRAIGAVAKLVDSPGGALWMRDEEVMRLVETWNLPVDPRTTIAMDGEFCRFLDAREWIVDLAQLAHAPEVYAELAIPDWLQAIDQAWLVVPLKQGEQLLGLMVLANSRAMRDLTWEDHDLLKTVGRQVGGHLALHQSVQLLSQTRQFQAYHRLTAFIMHDLKNLIAQQSLVVKNAAKHKGNPEFVDDAIATVDNSVQRMHRLLEQLQRGDSGRGAQTARLREVGQKVVERSAQRKPLPELVLGDTDARVSAPQETLIMVLGHLVRNAQEATPPDGSVTLIVSKDDGHAIITIQDTGSGMSPQFVRERLFRPFDTTKGSKGMGIGVYQAREFMRSMGGSLEVDSTEGRGSTFVARLPLVKAGRKPTQLSSTGARE